MRSFRGLGGWWVVAQFTVLGSMAAALLALGDGWGIAAALSGLGLTALGALLAIAGLVTLGENLSPFPAPRADATLVARGVYCRVRHPIYGGLILGSAGMAIADGNPIVLGLTVLLTVLFWFKAGHEERRLVKRFPEYRTYRSRVRHRLLPWLL